MLLDDPIAIYQGRNGKWRNRIFVTRRRSRDSNSKSSISRWCLLDFNCNDIFYLQCYAFLVHALRGYERVYAVVTIVQTGKERRDHRTDTTRDTQSWYCILSFMGLNRLT